MPFSDRHKKVVQAASLFFLILIPTAFAQQPAGDGFFTTSDGVKLHYLEAGQGETILFIPGWLMPADIWQKQIDDLSQDHHVIALDPRSQGQSDMTPQGNDPFRRSKDVRELLDHLQVNSVVLVGWSLGAFDALAYLHEFGVDRVNGLVLVDSPLAAPSSPAPAQRSPFLQRFQSDREHVGDDYVWSLFKKPLPAPFRKKLRAAQARVPTDIALAALDNTRPGEAWEPKISVLKKISILYVITPTYTSQADYLKEIDPDARVETFENCGHALFVDEFQKFNDLLRDFLKQAPLTPPATSHKHKKPAPTPATTSLPVTVQTTSEPSAVPTQPAALKPIPVPTRIFTPHPTRTPRKTATPTPSFTPRPSPAPTKARPTPRPTRTPKNTPTATTVLTPTPHHRKIKPSPTATALPQQPTQQPSQQPIQRPSKPSWANAGNPIQDGYFTTSDHVRLHYLEAGTGLTLVFIPGWLISAEVWMPQLQDLSADYHVVALDPRSQGLSDMTPQGDEPMRQAKDIQELMDHLQLSSAVLIGWSHGAFHVLSYVNEFGTSRLYAFVLVDSSLGAAQAPPDSSTRQAKFIEEYKKDPETALRGFIWGLFKTPPPANFSKDLNQSALRTPPEIALGLMNNIYPGDRWQPPIQTVRQIPLLYAVTDKFAFQAQYLTQVDPLARVEIFQNTGHALFVDDSVHFNTVLRDFLRSANRYPSGWPTRPKPTATPHP